jgi:transposase
MIVMGLDQHRGQITAEWIETASGEVSRARIVPAHREAVRRFFERFRGRELEVALEATTGWRFVVEELRAVGAGVHPAEPAETSVRRGPKKRAKSDRADARHLRELLMIARVPESWIPPDHLLARAREQITVAIAMVDALEAQIAPLDRELRAYARRQAGCRALMRHYGIGALTAVAILAELGDCRRFSSSRHAVRYSGLDITVHESDQRRAPGHLSRQGPPALRWALFEAAQVARRPGSPDRDYYTQAADRLGANRACLAVARKLLKRSYHTLRELGEEALAPA